MPDLSTPALPDPTSLRTLIYPTNAPTHRSNCGKRPMIYLIDQIDHFPTSTLMIMYYVFWNYYKFIPLSYLYLLEVDQVDQVGSVQSNRWVGGSDR